MRIALGIEYDGTDFFGWQRQSEGRTVQACVEAALTEVADHPVTVVCAGRTDTGVHATGQVVHFDSTAVRAMDGWRRGANAHLPADVRVQWAHPVDETFHARFGATERHYRYIIHNHRVRSALLRNRVCWEYAQLDVSRMKKAASYLYGEHDFTSFRAVACQAHSPVRTISHLEVCRSGDFIYLDVKANAFLHHMVRCIAGVLIAVGRNEQSPEWGGELLEAKDRRLSGMNGPPEGLYLVAVSYPGHFELPSNSRLPAYD
ncbi:MAG: tRNA pseudouridine(38-40) synthase TruA [Gammaproteobacteria bacterium]|nr:tRNA pseudouridine(38-40) synthase TruA [Gammaproteobacteria bacterium]